jgi:GNAT superfamily N-acetyltransferase
MEKARMPMPTKTSTDASAIIRPGRRDEAVALSALAMRSKSHWGYDEEFLEAVRAALTFTPADFDQGPFWVLELDGELTGLYHIVGRAPEGELADLWLEPTAIGRGLGRTLFEHALETAATLGFETLLIESDPNAIGFYLTMGAEHVGHRRSDVGRWLPLVRVAVPSEAARSS